MILGFSPYQEPDDGIGPFSSSFNKGVNLKTVDSLAGVDAVVLWGGEDIAPILYAEKPVGYSGPESPSRRDLFEHEICRQAYLDGKPIIGVCRGAQFICAFAGGKLVQDVSGHNNGSGHLITTDDGKRMNVTSAHHQMLYPYDVEHKLIAWSTERRSERYVGISKEEQERMETEPEVVYFPEVNGYAIQCHPEWHTNIHIFNSWVMNSIKAHCFK